jgi:FixJ family two-component response regulator
MRAGAYDLIEGPFDFNMPLSKIHAAFAGGWHRRAVA